MTTQQHETFATRLAERGYQLGALTGEQRCLTPLAMQRLGFQALETVWDGACVCTQIVRANGAYYACQDGQWWLIVKVV